MRPLVELHWREWGGDSVVYEAKSGRVVRLNPFVAAVIGCFEERPSTLLDVRERLADALEGEAQADVDVALAGVVDEFSRLGWLELQAAA